MAKFSRIPLAEVGSPAPGTVWGHTYQEAVQLIDDVLSGTVVVVDTTQEPVGEGILENIDDRGW